MRKCTACREYRIPIKAALNETAGVHSLKVVISPAATVANQKAADYKYGVPGLTQPGALLCCATSSHHELDQYLQNVLLNNCCCPLLPSDMT